MDSESLVLEVEHWQSICEALRQSPDLPAFQCLPALAQRIGTATWDGLEGEMVYISADPSAWDACLVALDMADPPTDGKRSLGFWLLSARKCSAKSRELAGKK